MIYRKEMSLPGIKRERITLGDFSGGLRTVEEENLLPQRFATECFNVAGGSGALKRLMGVEAFRFREREFMLSAGLRALFCFHRYDRERDTEDDRLVAQGEDGYLYAAPLFEDGGFVSLNVKREGKLSAVNYRLNGEDVLIISSESEPMLVWDGVNAPYEVPEAPYVTSLCVHYERLFATTAGDKSELWFSDDLNVTNWHISLDEAGFIQLADEGGGILRAVEFMDYVYLFRSYGIARVSAYADQTQFRVTKIYQSTGKIYPDTVTVCGDRIYFLSEEGAFSFDGLDAVRVMPEWQEAFESNQPGAFACRHGGRWYLAVRLKYTTPWSEDESGYQNNALVCYDLYKKKAWVMRGVDVRGLCMLELETGSAALVLTQNRQAVGVLRDSGCFFGKPLLMRWQTPWTDLNRAERKKVLRSVTVTGKGDYTVEVESDTAARKKSFGGSMTAAFSVQGNRFRLTFESADPEFCISKPQLIVDTREG
ncbi:MAG: hypothetical protein IJF71_05570 [Clostridia bacterium]|nr:hypothetical protein [Clostridia bacterium]